MYYRNVTFLSGYFYRTQLMANFLLARIKRIFLPSERHRWKICIGSWRGLEQSRNYRVVVICS